MLYLQQFRKCYGSPRIHAELQAQGGQVGKTRVARLMQALGIRGKGGQKRRPRTTQSDASHLVMPNVLLISLMLSALIKSG